MAEQHASLGASNASRWMNCPGSVTLLQQVEPEYLDKVSIHALTGTAAHALGEKCLKDGLDPQLLQGTEMSGIAVDDEMTYAVGQYVKYCSVLIKNSFSHGQYHIEKRFSLDALNPPQKMFGTADFVSLDPPELYVVDYKHGQGVVVEVEDNPQMMYYALGAALEVEKGIGRGRIDTITMTIVQPRAPHTLGSVRSWSVDYLTLIEFGVELMAKAREALDPNAPRVPGPQCRWCKAAAICPEVASQSMAVAKQEFGQALDLPKPNTLSPVDISYILNHRDMLQKWLTSVDEYAMYLLNKGEEVTGWKQVAKRAYRNWVDEETTLQWCSDHNLTRSEVYNPPKMKTVAQLEKVVGKADPIPADLISKVSSGMTLAPEADKRPAVLSAKEEFGDK